MLNLEELITAAFNKKETQIEQYFLRLGHTSSECGMRKAFSPQCGTKTILKYFYLLLIPHADSTFEKILQVKLLLSIAVFILLLKYEPAFRGVLLIQRYGRKLGLEAVNDKWR